MVIGVVRVGRLQEVELGVRPLVGDDARLEAGAVLGHELGEQKGKKKKKRRGRRKNARGGRDIKKGEWIFLDYGIVYDIGSDLHDPTLNWLRDYVCPVCS